MTLRVRSLGPNGDYQIFRGVPAEFLVDSPAAVRQKIQTRLLLFQGEFFVDLGAGTPWLQQILGRHASAPPQPGQAPSTGTVYDMAIKTVIANTPGVSQLVSYSSVLDGSSRALSIEATVMTIFSTTPISIVTAVPLVPLP